MTSDTIFALATAPGRAAVAVVRLSGPACRPVLTALCGRPPQPRLASLRALRDPGTGAVIDQALVLWFPAPASYTGDDGAEFHVHGGLAVVEALIDVLLSLGLKLAEPGAFTRRAFENGKLDLSQAEAVADLVDAETQAQRGQALAQLGGALARRHASWRRDLIEVLAVLEAAVDFPDEDLPDALAKQALPLIRGVRDEIDAALLDGARGERVREGFRIALIGAPNAGKSSVLNALAGRSAAIVTEIPGTTRDIIEVPLVMAGYRVLIADTAGVRMAADSIEAEGVRRAQAWAESAALRVLVVDGAENADGWREAADLAKPGDICFLNKQDLSGGVSSAEAWAPASGLTIIRGSTVSATGLGALSSALETRVVTALSGGEFPAATQARHRIDLSEAYAHLVRAVQTLSLAGQVELAAEDVRLAARRLARVGGRVDPEDVLDRVFARFCIGK